MRSQREQNLEEQFVRLDVIGIVRETILSANLAKFARPIRENNRAAFVCKRSVTGPVGPVEATTHEPAACQLVLAGRIEAECPLFGWKLLPLTPDELVARNERVIDRSAQWFPSQSGIDPV